MSRAAFILLLALPILAGQMCVAPDLTDDNPDPSTTPDNGSTTTPDPTAKALNGPGFSLEIPAGFTAQTNVTVPTGAAFRAAYGDGQRLIVVSTHDADPDGLYTFECTAIRIQCTQNTDSGDLVLVTTLADPSLAGEDMAGYALLADGGLLCVRVCAGGTLGTEDQAVASAVFGSIALENADGSGLVTAMAAHKDKLLGYTSNGLIILDDLSAWALADDATDAQRAELAAWTAGGPVHIQDTNDGEELVMVGRWSAIPVRSLGLAIKTQLAGYDVNIRRVSFLNGLSQGLPYSNLPAFWKSGDEVLILRDRPYDWLIRTRTWSWLRM